MIFNDLLYFSQIIGECTLKKKVPWKRNKLIEMSLSTFVENNLYVNYIVSKNHDGDIKCG